MEDTAHRAIAIVGVGAVLPDAVNAGAFWENVKNGRYSITEVRPDRWDPALYYDSDPTAPDKAYSKIGGWVREHVWEPMRHRRRQQDPRTFGDEPLFEREALFHYANEHEQRRVHPERFLHARLHKRQLTERRVIDREAAEERHRHVRGLFDPAPELRIGHRVLRRRLGRTASQGRSGQAQSDHGQGLRHGSGLSGDGDCRRQRALSGDLADRQGGRLGRRHAAEGEFARCFDALAGSGFCFGFACSQSDSKTDCSRRAIRGSVMMMPTSRR